MDRAKGGAAMPLAATLAPRLESFLAGSGIAIDVIPHTPSASSRAAAAAAHVPADRLAKAVLLKDDSGYVLAVVPASRRIAIDRLDRRLGRDFELASERELAAIFSDCDPGAIPPFGGAYGIPTVVDELLLHLPEVYFDAGAHDRLARVTGADFAGLLSGRPHGAFSEPAGPSATAVEPLRGPEPREERLDERELHVFSLRAFGSGLRAQAEYERNGHAGLLLVKTPELRVLLEAMDPGTRLATHVVRGPATAHVLEGALDVATANGVHRVGEGEIAALPRDEQREIRAPARALFVLSIARPGNGMAPKAKPRAKRVLIVANRTAGGRHLLEEVRVRMAEGPCDFVVLSPAVSARVGMPFETIEARDEARVRLELACERLRRLGAPVRGVIGDAYPLRAIADVLLHEDFDEVLVSTLPAPVSEWLKLDLPTRVWRRFQIPVTHVVARD
jgi:Ala-tRNA(Pro) deacylase